MQGWIKLHRQIQTHYMWLEKPFSRGQAWIDLIMLVNHEDKKVLFDGNLVEVKIGQHITSIRKLCDRWGWSNTKVCKYLENLQQEKMLTYFSDKKKTVITLENYELYQNETTKKRHRNDTETTLKHTNKNDKNNKELYKDYIYLSQKEHESLILEYGESVAETYIDRLNDYIAQIGESQAKKKYKSHYATIRNWYRRDQDKKVVSMKPKERSWLYDD